MRIAATRVYIAGDPFLEGDRGGIWYGRGLWPCRWIAVNNARLAVGKSGPSLSDGRNDDGFAQGLVAVYRLQFKSDTDRTVRFHVTADERYELFIDGSRIGRGPERCAPDHWRYESYDLAVDCEEHTLVARVWSLGEMAPCAQMSVGHGLLLCPEAEADRKLLGTGIAPWEAKQLAGYAFRSEGSVRYVGWTLRSTCALPDADWESGGGDGWKPAAHGDFGVNDFVLERFNAHTLVAATLPPMLDRNWSGATVRFAAPADKFDMSATPVRGEDCVETDVEEWSKFVNGTAPLIVAPGTRRRAIVDLTDYVCFYLRLTASGVGGTIRIAFAESLYEPTAAEPRPKGNRDVIEGRLFCDTYSGNAAPGILFEIGGVPAREYGTLWWQCGRYVEFVAEAGTQPLAMSGLAFCETRYPLEFESRFSCSDPRLEHVIPMMVRSMQMCAHETYMDCPFYEQLQYIGDTRLECLTTYMMTRDDRLPRKALELFAESVVPSGLTQSRYPSRLRQFVPTFSLWFVDMLYDYAMWRGDLDFVRSLMPKARGVLDYYRGLIDSDGIIAAPGGWPFVDWAPEYDGAVPYGGQDGPCGPIQWQTIYTLEIAARLEDILGEPLLAERLRGHSASLAEATHNAFYDAGRSLYADDFEHTRFSEHAQCLALLSGKVSPERAELVANALFSAPDLIRATVYFAHYLFETCYTWDRPDVLIDRLQMWFDMPALGLKTTLERPEPSRSDCHAWGAHPLYHYFATILGIRPAAPGFSKVSIMPRLGALAYAQAELVHPMGVVKVSARRDAGGCSVDVDLPHGVSARIFDKSEVTGKARVEG